VEPREFELSNQHLPGDAERDKLTLAPVRQSLIDAGYYAYTTIDEQNRWSVAVDDETGRVDVHLGRDGLEVVLWSSSPGLLAEDDNEWRRRSRARLVRMRLPAINRGFLEPHQAAMWDETEQGVAVTETYELPFTRGDYIGTFVREHLPKLEDLLIMIEQQLA
jgi:hypothetical protein